MMAERNVQRVLWLRLLLVPLTFGGCSSRSRHGDSPTAGVPWFTPARGDASIVWRVDATPVWALRSGADGGGFAEPTDATELSDGSFVVADHRAGMLHYISRDGAPVRVVGRTGSGPGEFRSLEGVGGAGRDTIWAFDHSLRRITIFGKTGDVLTTYAVRITGRPSWPSVVGVLVGNRAVVLERNLPLPAGQQPGAAWRDSSRLVWYSMPLQSSSVSLEVPLFDTYINPAGPMVGIAFIPFGPRLAVAMSPSDHEVYVGFPESFEVSRISPTGERRGFLRRPFAGRRVTQEDLRRREAATRRPPRTIIPKSLIPASMPAFGRLLADWSGGLWVQEYEPEGDGRRWASFDARGVLRALVLLPAGFSPLLVDGGLLLGVQEGEDGAPIVTLLKLPSS